MNVTAFEDAYLSRINTIAQSEEINLRVANALRFVIQNVFANITNAFVFTISTSDGPTEFWLHDTMGKLFSTWGLIAVQLVVLDSKTKYLNVPGKRYCNMIMVDSFESLLKADIASYNRNTDTIEYYYIFLQVHDNLVQSDLAKIMRYCFDNYWIHCNVMVQTSKGQVSVYTYFPYKENNCFKTQAELINRFVTNKFENDVMFPEKLANLHGCPLKLSTWETIPFGKNMTNKRSPNIPVGGFEIFTLITISKKMNFTLNIEWLSIETYDQNKLPDTEPLSKLINYDTNITMGYFRRTSERDKSATPTYSTYYIPLVAIILRKEANHNSMGIWTFPFNTTTWTIIVIVYIFIGMLNIFQKIKFKGGIFEIFGIFIGVPVNNLPKFTSTRIRFMTTVVSSFILRSIYQSLLFHIFRTNFYQAPPLTFNSLVEDGYKAVATELTSRFLLNVPQIKDNTLPLTVINNTNEMHPLRYLELYKNESLVAMSIIEFAMSYVSGEMSNGNALQVLPINVNDQQICFYLPKHSHFSARFSQYILHLQQIGLLNKWREWIISELQVYKEEASTAYNNTYMVNLSELIGFLLLIIFLHLVSILMFILEIMSKRYKWLQKFFE